MSRNTLMISPAMLKERTGLHDAVDEKLIYPEIKAVQDIYVLPLLGTALFDKVLDEIDANTLTGVYKTLVDDYLIDTIINYVLSELPDGINYQFTNKGLVQKTSENTNQPSMSDMYAVMSKYKNRAEHYETRARLYLKKNYTSFTEYENPGTGVDVVKPEDDSFTNPFYLGE